MGCSNALLVAVDPGASSHGFNTDTPTTVDVSDLLYKVEYLFGKKRLYLEQALGR